jgi:hypothetical protein
MRCLFIDSRDKVAGGSNTDFKIQLPTTLVLEKGAQFRIDNLRIPMVIPLIQQGVNHRLYVKVESSGTQYFYASLPQGSYSGVELAQLIQTQLDFSSLALAGVDWTVVYDEHTASMAINCTSDFEILTDEQASAHWSGSIYNFATKLFANDYAYHDHGVLGKELVFSHVSMVAIDMIYLSSSKLSNPETFGPQGTCDSLLAAVTTSDFASVMDVSMPWDVWLTAPSMTTQQLDFALRGRDYKILTGLPNISFTLTIR